MPGLVARQIGGGGGEVAQRISVSVSPDPSAASVAFIFHIVGCQAVSQGLVTMTLTVAVADKTKG